MTRRAAQAELRHVLVVSDRCFSGMLMREVHDSPALPDDREPALRELAGRRSRALLASGANEPVLDRGGSGHSLFAAALLVGLTTRDKPLTAGELLEADIRRRVAGSAKQAPQYRPLVAIGDAGGELVFVPQTSAFP